MLAGIHQLHYLPWLRYIEKIARSDIFLILDQVQFVKQDWHNRNKIKTAQGEMVLTVPVKQVLGQALDETAIDNGRKWQSKHIKCIKQNYSKATYFADYIDGLSSFYNDKSYQHLNAINRDMLTWFLDCLGIDTPVHYMSEMDRPAGKSSEFLVNACQALGATSYYCGSYAAEVYLDADLFASNSIDIVLQQWHCPSYQQLHMKKSDFISDLSILDLLFNEGPRSLEILMSGAT